MREIKSNFYYKIGSLTVFTPFLFFAINAILSFEYAGLSESNSYVIALVVAASLFCLLYFKNALLRKVFLLSELIVYLLLLVIFFMLLYDFNTEKNTGPTAIYQFCLMVVPVSLFALDFGASKRPEVIFQSFFIFCQFILISIIVVIPKMLSIDVIDLGTFYGGGHYQGFGYIVSLSFLINLCAYLFFIKKNIYVDVFFIISFIVHLSGIIFSGARGSMVVIILGSLVTLTIRFNIIRVFFYLIKGVFFLFFIRNLGLFYFDSYSERILESVDRIFSYISDGGIDMSKTSNRDILYTESVKLIKESPIVGYGFFDYIKHTGFGYPHNFFLEVLLQGGIIYLIVWFLILVFFFINLVTLIKKNINYIIILPFVTYSFIQLLFSGSYLLEQFFWFSIIFVFSANSRLRISLKI